MSRITRWAVLTATLMSLFAMLSSSAAAVTWHNSGDTAFTAGGTAGTMSVTGVNAACTGSSETGTSPSASFVGTNYNLATGSASFSGCSLSGLPSSIDCTWLFIGAAVTGNVALGVLAVVCALSQFGTEICKIEGQTSASYTNPVSPSTFGKFVLNHSATLRTTNGAGGSCPLGVGEPLTLTTRTWTISNATGGPSPHLGPVITRTA